MDEIKYRAWHFANKPIVYFDWDKVAKDQYQMQHLCRLLAGNHQDGIMMKYTGYNYKDTNEEMYTGDVVYIAGYGNCEIAIDKFYRIMLKKGNQEYHLVDSIIEGDYPVKIGNKYKNPDLLGGENG
jgi:hypothetical protein